jgi:thiamine pyrophosphokinase
VKYQLSLHGDMTSESEKCEISAFPHEDMTSDSQKNVKYQLFLHGHMKSNSQKNVKYQLSHMGT